MNNLIFTTVYHYESPEEGVVLHAYRTREGILAKGGKVLEETAREVPGYEVTPSGVWKPDRNPVI